MKIFNIFKKQKNKSVTIKIEVDDNWRKEHFQKNIKIGVKSLKKFKQVLIYDDGTGYKLATEIKKQYINENKTLAENIEIKEYSWGYCVNNVT